MQECRILTARQCHYSSFRQSPFTKNMNLISSGRDSGIVMRGGLHRRHCSLSSISLQPLAVRERNP
ncbi:unnamed protein product, partial [Amoebophrya sp. A25]